MIRLKYEILFWRQSNGLQGNFFSGHAEKEHYSQRVHPSTHTEGNIGRCKFLKYLIAVLYTISHHAINHIEI